MDANGTGQSVAALRGVIDVELTNRCNARCGFCPRDATPHQGVMTVETFRQTLARVVEVRDQARLVLAGAEGDLILRARRSTPAPRSLRLRA